MMGTPGLAPLCSHSTGQCRSLAYPHGLSSLGAWWPPVAVVPSAAAAAALPRHSGTHPTRISLGDLQGTLEVGWVSAGDQSAITPLP